MRISLQATSSQPLSLSRTDNVSLSVIIKPSNNVPGSFEYQTDSKTLLKLLRLQTDLSGYALDFFRAGLERSTVSRLAAVSVKDEVLEGIGYLGALHQTSEIVR